MRSFLILSTLLVSALSATIPSPGAKYEGTKVYRIPTGEDNIAKVQDIIAELKLATWKAPNTAGLNADIVVPPKQLDAFKKATEGLNVLPMHENLGASIAEETQYGAYEGT